MELIQEVLIPIGHLMASITMLTVLFLGIVKAGIHLGFHVGEWGKSGVKSFLRNLV